MSRPGLVCKCWRLRDGYHRDVECPFSGMQWREVADRQDEAEWVEPDAEIIAMLDADYLHPQV